MLDKHLRLPSDARLSLGYDHRFENSTTLSLEGLYTKGIDNFFYENLALAGKQGTDRFGRVMYGDISSNGTPLPALINPNRKEIYTVVNESNDYAYNGTATLQKQFSQRFEGSVAYSYGHSYTAMDQTSSVAQSNFRYSRPTSGDEFSPTPGVSTFDVPNRVVAQASYSFPTKTDVSFIYTGQSGAAYDYVYSGSSAFGSKGDMNGDGIVGNDLIYVPTNVNDPNQIQWAYSSAVKSTDSPAAKLADIQAQKTAFQNFIDSDPCLRDQEGHILKRNSCRSPWVNSLNLSVRQNVSVPSLHGHNLSVQLDVFNFLNLLDKNWGQFVYPPSQGSQYILNTVGYCAAGGWDQINNKCTTTASALTTTGAGGVPVFTYTTTQQRLINIPSRSNYQLQLSARYSF